MAQKKLGNLLLSSGLITERQLERALLEQRETKGRLGTVLVKLEYITTDKLLDFLSRRLNIRSINLNKLKLDPDVVRIIPEKFARERNLIAVQAKEKRLVVALGDPTDYDALDQITFLTGYKFVSPVLAIDDQITQAIDRYYASTYTTMGSTVSNDANHEDTRIEIISYGDEDNRAPEKVAGKDEITVGNLIQQMLKDAVARDVSHIHLEPSRETLQIQMRIDLKIYNYTKIEKRLERGLINKIKIMADIDPIVKNRPLDGFFQIRSQKNEKPISVMVSVFPSYFGERMVLNLRKTVIKVPTLDNLGMSDHTLTAYKGLLAKKNGFIVVTGPYHHGKTTTLYSTLATLASSGRIIFSYEEALRDELEGVVQTVQRVDGDPVRDIRAIVKQNPDVLMVTDMLPLESYRMAMTVAMGNMMILCRYHAIDAFAVLSSFLEMGLPPYLIANSITGIVAQRLVRRLCDSCKKVDPKVPSRLIEHAQNALKIEQPTFYIGLGCDKCNRTGYDGMIPIFELLAVDKKMSDLIINSKSIQDMRQQALGNGMIPFQLDALGKAAVGKTSYEEMLNLR